MVLLAFVAVAACETGVFDVDMGVAPASIELDLTDIDLVSGRAAVIQAKVQDAKGKPINVGAGGVQIEWSSSDDWIAPITPLGQATARVIGGAAGTAEITAVVHHTVAQAGFLALLQGSSDRGGIRASSSIHVRPANLVAVAGNGQSGAVGSTLPGELIVRAVNESGQGVPNVEIQFTAGPHNGTLDPSSAITDQEGRARTRWTLGTAAGAMKAEAGAHNRYKLTPVEFTATALEDENGGQVAASVTVSPTAATLSTGATQQFSATVKDANGATISTPSLTWTSSNTDVATVNGSGLVTARAAGSATLTARSGDASGTAAINVQASATPAPPSGLLPAFPGAEGWGATALNESRKLPLVVHKVTNTNDSGPGSLRDILENRVRTDRYDIIIFRTGGLIQLQSPMLFTDFKRHIYMAGQTAPGGGISLIGDRFDFRQIEDAVFRHFRHRGHNSVGLRTRGARVIWDHITASWAGTPYASSANIFSIDSRIVPPYTTSDITVQNSLIYEGGEHSTLLVVNGGNDGWIERISLHRNVVLGPGWRAPKTSGGGELVFANNVVYNFTDRGSAGSRAYNSDFINNYYKNGPSSGTRRPFMLRGGDSSLGTLEEIAAGCTSESDPCHQSLHLSGNRTTQNNYNASAPPAWTGANREIGCHDQLPWCDALYGEVPAHVRARIERLTPLPHAPVPVTIQGMTDAVVRQVVDVSGHSRRLTCDGSWTSAREAVDTERIGWFFSGTGWSHRSEYNTTNMGYVAPAPGTPCTDSDNDGLPDAWEDRFFGCTTCANPAATTPSGYLVIEHYLNGTDPTR